MKSPTLRSAKEWRALYPAARALILVPVSRDKPNSSFILNAKEDAPEGKFRMLGLVE